MSPYTALAMLVLFKGGKMPLTESAFDECVDRLVALLEDCNDERYRLTKDRLIVTPTGE